MRAKQSRKLQTLLAVTATVVAATASAYFGVALAGAVFTEEIPSQPTTTMPEEAGVGHDALADGIVTDSERVEAHLAMLACIQDAGVNVVSFRLRPTGDSLVTDDTAGAEDTTARCRAHHYGEVGLAYALAREIPIDEWNEKIAACLDGLGLEPDSLDPEDWPDFFGRDYGKCAAEARPQ